MKIYTFKVALLQDKRTYRIIEIHSEQSLHDLHMRIFNAFNRDDESHLYSFYLPERPTQSIRIIRAAEEYTDPRMLKGKEVNDIDDMRDAARMKIGMLRLRVKQKFYYLFDFGDCWWHEITVMPQIDDEPPARVMRKEREFRNQISLFDDI